MTKPVRVAFQIILHAFVRVERRHPGTARGHDDARSLL